MDLFTRRTKEMSLSWLSEAGAGTELKHSEPECWAPSWRVSTVKGHFVIYLNFWDSTSDPCDCFLNILWSLNVTSRCFWWLSKQCLWKTSFLWNSRYILQAAMFLHCYLQVISAEILEGCVSDRMENQALESGRKLALSQNGKKKFPRSAFSNASCN